MIYLDNPATSMQKPACVINAMCHNTAKFSVNAGRGGHFASVLGAKGIINTQEEVAQLFGISEPWRIAFTQNATYALNIAISGLLKKGDHAVVTSMEHNSVLRPMNKSCKFTVVYANERGEINPIDIENAILPETKLVAVTHASNVCGTILPVREIGAICKKHEIPFLLDSAQTAGIVPINVEEMNVSLLAFSGHKGLLGPLGTGGLYVRDGIELAPLIVGGTGTESKNLNQPTDFPDMLHCGTMNTPAIMALGTAIRFVRNSGVERILYHEQALANKLVERLGNIKGVQVYGLYGKGRNGTVAFNVSNMDSVMVSDILDKEFKIATRGGYHCAYLAHKTIGTEKLGAVRVGFGYFSKLSELEKLTDAVNKIAKNAKNIG